MDPTVVSKLVGLVQQMVNEGGDPVGFDAHAWTVDWLTHPVPALGGACPADYLQTEDGRAVVETLLMQIQSGAYS